MKAWHIENLNRIKLVESVLPKREGEIKLKVSKVAISSTDFAYFAAGEEDEHGKSVVVPGHSAVAYVSSEDSAAGLKLGARVVVSPFVRYEEHGVAKVKVLGVDTDGLLGDFASVPEENVYALPDGIPDDEAIFAEYIALGNNVLNSMEADKGDFVVIVGASTLGLVLSQLALYYQMIPILVDLDAEKLALAASWGVYYLLNPTYDNLERRVEEITGGRMAEASVYVGDGVPFDCAFRLVKDKGEVVVAGYSVRDVLGDQPACQPHSQDRRAHRRAHRLRRSARDGRAMRGVSLSIQQDPDHGRLTRPGCTTRRAPRRAFSFRASLRAAAPCRGAPVFLKNTISV